MLNCEVYAAFTLTISAIWTTTGRDWSIRTLYLVLFLPGLFVPWFVKNPEFTSRIVGTGRYDICVQFSVIGGVFSMVTIALCLGVVHLTGWGEIDERAKVDDTLHDLLTGLARAAAEEIGWRCYLLPCLMQRYGALPALCITGVVWALFNMPVTVLLSARHHHPRPACTVLAQALWYFLAAFPHGWVAIRSGFAVWPSTLMHYTWNRLNPVVLGSVHTNRPGKVTGPQWLVNGEGVAGCLVMLPAVSYVIYTLLYGVQYAV